MEEDTRFDTFVTGGKRVHGTSTSKERESGEQRATDSDERRSTRKKMESRSRWSVLVEILDALSKENRHDSKWDELPPSVLEHVNIECKISHSEIKSVWREYTSQHNAGRKGHHEFSMISNKHCLSIMKSAGSSDDWERECEQRDKDSRLHHYRLRHDCHGNEYNIQRVVEVIAEVNNLLGQEATIRELSAEIFGRFDLFIPRTTLGKILHDFKFDVEISHVKPKLSLKIKRRRVCFVISQLEPSGVQHEMNGRFYFKFSPHKNRVSNNS